MMSTCCGGELPSSDMKERLLEGQCIKSVLLMTAPCKQYFPYEAASIKGICNVFREGGKFL